MLGKWCDGQRKLSHEFRYVAEVEHKHKLMLPKDLRRHALWAPLRAKFRLGRESRGDYTIEVWEEPCVPGTPNLDDWMVCTFGSTIRLAVFDGAENRALGQPKAQVQALRAVEVARRWLRVEENVPEALQSAAQELHDESLPNRLHNPMCQVAVVDINRDESAEVWRVGDAEVWMNRHGGWKRTFSERILTEEAQETLDTWEAENADMVSTDAIWKFKETVHQNPDVWTCPPLGFLAEPIIERTFVQYAKEIIVSTDGARLNEERCQSVFRWMSSGLQILPPDHPHPSPHGDLALIRVQHSTSSVSPAHRPRTLSRTLQ